MMKPERRPFPRRSQTRHRRIRSETCLAFPNPVQEVGGEVTKKQLSSEIDVEMLLHFSQQLYAHALTLQEVIRNEGKATYEVLKPRYDRQAEQQFEIFYQNFKQS